jgi:hypothetical protein
MRDSVMVTLKPAADQLMAGSVTLVLFVKEELLLGLMVIMPGEMWACNRKQ